MPEPEREFYADGFGDISVASGVVRLDLVARSMTRTDAEGNPVMELRQRVIMPLDGFAQGLRALEELVRQLVEAGVLQIDAAGAATPAPSPPAGTRPDTPAGG